MSATQSDARRLALAGGASADGHRKLGAAAATPGLLASAEPAVEPANS